MTLRPIPTTAHVVSVLRNSPTGQSVAALHNILTHHLEHTASEREVQAACTRLVRAGTVQAQAHPALPDVRVYVLSEQEGQA